MDKYGVPADSKHNVFTAIDAWHKAVMRRVVFAASGIRYADQRAGLLEAREWERSKGAVCRMLERTLDGATEVRRLAEELDAAFVRVAARANDNPGLHFEMEKGKPEIVPSKLDSLDEPESLSALRRDVH